jgi:hypothetical protein
LSGTFAAQLRKTVVLVISFVLPGSGAVSVRNPFDRFLRVAACGACAPHPFLYLGNAS